MNKYPLNIQESEVINRVREDWFSDFDTVRAVKKIDFSVYEPMEPSLLAEPYPFLWAEAKKGNSTDMEENLVQLALTIGKHKVYTTGLQPVVIAAFDAERIVFLEYDRIMSLFVQPWVDWNITPSDHCSEMFGRVHGFLKDALSHRMTFNWIDDEKALHKFIKTNFKRSSDNVHKIEINRTSFVSVYFRWREKVKDTIAVDWSVLAKNGIHDRDFFLADLISSDGKTLRDNLAVTLKQDIYKVHKQISGMGFFADVPFKDRQKAYNLFWNSYSRPPKEEYWNYILERADLLIPEDQRAYEGAYYTPRIWVEKSHLILSEIFGDLWQEDYYIWDCAAGSGNLLRGLTNRRNVWASTDLQGDVDRMHSSIDAHDLNLFKSHVFQFDFLDDDLDGPKVPDQLKEILRSPEKRRKLLFLVNTPFAEAGDKDTVTGKGENKTDVATRYKTYAQYKDTIGIAAREIYAQFLIKMYSELPGCIIAQFSTLKHLTAPNFYKFRSAFQAFLFEPKFVVPATSFDNVKGKFPIGFFVWDTSVHERFNGTYAEYYDRKGNSIGRKKIPSYDNCKTINDWIIETRVRGGLQLGFMYAAGCDIQHQNYNYIIRDKSHIPHPRGTEVTDKNFLEICVYHAAVHCVTDNWINDRDLYLYPFGRWWEDREFLSDCIIHTLFDNRIELAHGPNHWIPFDEDDVDCQEGFSHHTVRDMLTGRKPMTEVIHDAEDVFGSVDANEMTKWVPLDTLSSEAAALFETGKEIWKYYFSQPGAVPDAGWLDISKRFQKRNVKGDLSGHSDDQTYESLFRELGVRKKILENRIAVKVFEFGFLIR